MEKFKKELKRTLYHELTHHVESLAGDRSLEYEDDRFMADYEAMSKNEPLDVDSVLFAGRDVDLITAAAALFDLRCREKGDAIPCACTYTGEGEAPEVSPKMKKAAELLLDRKYPPEQVAPLVGFATINSFYRSFKDYYGLPPLEWVSNQQDSRSP